MKVVVASGKGGVGKSMVASCLATFFHEAGKKVVACDCDVDAPNMHVWLGVKRFRVAKILKCSKKAFVKDEAKLLRCKLDPKVCKFGALKRKGASFEIDELLCEGCGACYMMCSDGIGMRTVENAEIRLAKTRFGFPLAFAQLYPGEKSSGRVVDEIVSFAEGIEHETMVMDAAAGIGCPLISSLKFADHVLLVVEPTVSGLSDLHRVLRVVKHFQREYSILLNKVGLNACIERKLRKKFSRKLVGEIPYAREVFACLNRGTLPLESAKLRKCFHGAFERLVDFLR